MFTRWPSRERVEQQDQLHLEELHLDPVQLLAGDAATTIIARPRRA
jgi:hypothetical protein